jgi:hypothetical protein
MPLNDVIFERNKSGLGTPLTSKDHVSGLIFYSDTLPSGFGSSDRIKKINSVEEAEDLGILDSNAFKKEHYHISECFEKNPQCEIYLGFFDIPAVVATPDFLEIDAIVNFSNGDVRQIGIYYVETPFTLSLAATMQSRVNVLQTEHKPLQIVFGPSVEATTVSAIPDLTTASIALENVSVTIGQSATGVGAALFDSEAVSITDLGATLGFMSLANVHESIAWVEKFNLVTNGVEFDEVAFATGEILRDLSKTAINAVDIKRYIFAVKHVGYGGSYKNDSYTGAPSTNDLATIENGRTIDKAIRNARAYLLPKLSSPLYVKSDGTLSPDTIATFKGLAVNALGQMKSDGELSAFDVVIDANQNVLSTSKLYVTLKLVPVGVAREIVVKIGFTPKV